MNGISARGQEAGAVRATDVDSRCRAALDGQREDFSRELIRKAYLIARLEQDLDEIRQIYETSLSWRLTRPMRLLRELLSRRRG